MSTQSFEAITPIDGRYQRQIGELKDFFSEGALIKARAEVEIRWLLHMLEEPKVLAKLKVSDGIKDKVRGLLQRLDTDFVMAVKKHEAVTNHDVKAVEYQLRELCQAAGLGVDLQAYLHFACTSEDINNLAYGLLLDRCNQSVLMPEWQKVQTMLAAFAETFAKLPMLSRTHGQPATPTTLGKEFAVFHWRFARKIALLKRQKFLGKCNGATGNFNAHVVAFPDVNWPAFSKSFVQSLGLAFNPLTTQIENHDSMVEWSQTLAHLNTIAIGLCRDIWSYISIGYFKQKVKAGEVGSSTMPHKVNPIDFENAEGNFGLANALLSHFAEKLPISRWQRDLSDSTVQRALGTATAHALLALKSLQKGLGKLEVAPDRLQQDLNGAWEVLAEAVQTVMRRNGCLDAYEQLKTATRGQGLTEASYLQLVAQLSHLTEQDRKDLRALRPETYLGVAAQLVHAAEANA